MRYIAPIAAGLLGGTSAQAADLRDLCPERPGLTEPACIVDKGHLLAEIGLTDWTLDRQDGERTDTLVAGDMLLRYGLGDTLEARIGWTAFGHVRERTSDGISRTARTGDVSLGMKQSLMHPDGSGLSIALLPSVTLPVGRQPVGAGDWGATLLLPLTYELNDAIEFDLTPQVDAAPDEDGHGRHLAYQVATGIQASVTNSIKFAFDYQYRRDNDPDGHENEHLGNVAMAWTPRDDLQLDIGTNVGLTRSSPDIELYVGVARRF